jgi:hypothetical protein
MEIDKANNLQSRLEMVHGRLKAITETMVRYSPEDPLAMAEEAVRHARQNAKACMTIIDQVHRMIEEEVAAARTEQNAKAQLGK